MKCIRGELRYQRAEPLRAGPTHDELAFVRDVDRHPQDDTRVSSQPRAPVASSSRRRIFFCSAFASSEPLPRVIRKSLHPISRRVIRSLLLLNRAPSRFRETSVDLFGTTLDVTDIGP